VRQADTLFCCNVGDSSAFLFFQENSVHLTAEHIPTNKDEYDRSHNLHFAYNIPEIQKSLCPPLWNSEEPKDMTYKSVRGDISSFVAPNPDECPYEIALGMTRSLGDFTMQKYGVTWGPSISIHSLPPSGTFRIILATDGLWDLWRHNEVKEVMDSHKGAKEAAETLLKGTQAKGIKHFGGDRDNVLIMVAFY